MTIGKMFLCFASIGPIRTQCRLLMLLAFVMFIASMPPRISAQGLSPTTPAKEYIRLGGSVIAIEFPSSGPPVISNVISTPAANTATVTWATNIPADSQVEYGPTSSYGNSTTLNSTMVTAHSQTVAGLTTQTLYHYRVKSRNSLGALTMSADFTFTTTTEPVISAVQATGITWNSATITWITDETANSQVDYGTTTAYGASTTLNPAMVTSHSVPLSNLASTTTYHYRVRSTDAAANLNVSGDYSFTTPAIPTFTISGFVSSPGNPQAGLANVTILINNVNSATTNFNGNFSVPNLTAGASYIVAPSSPSYIFNPGSQTIASLNGNQSLNFTSFAAPSGGYVSPNAGSGFYQQFIFDTAPVYGQPYPSIQMLFNTSSSTTAHGCYIFWTNTTGISPGPGMWLGNDAGTGFVSSFGRTIYSVPSTHLADSNSQCLNDYYNAYYVGNVPDLKVYIGPYFYRPFAGLKQVLMRVGNGSWVQQGNWTATVPSAADPTVAITSPAAGAIVPKSPTAVNLTGTVSSSSSTISSVRIQVDQTYSSSTALATVTGTTFSTSLFLSAGQAKITVVATDNHSPGQKAVASVTVTAQ